MAKGKAQAKALAQKQAAISSTESFQLVQCLVRVSVYHVCWMRGLFPEESFSGHELSQLDKMHIKVLRPKEGDEEAATLQQWVEQGVMHAVKHGYLKNMYFGIAQDAAATHLLEEYIYSFKYGEDGISFEVNASSKGKSKTKDKYNTSDAKKPPPNVDVVRYQVVRLMRMLVQVCQTLDQVPDERYLFIKLTYHDHTPDDYEPPFFHGVKEDGIGHFSRRPFTMDVGTMDTHHHTVSVRIKSVLDSCDDKEAEDADMQELEASQQISGMLDGLMDADDNRLHHEHGDEQEQAPEDGAAAAPATDQRTEEAMRMLVASQAADANDDMTLDANTEAAPTLAPPPSEASPAAAQPMADAAAAAAAADSADVTVASEGCEEGGEMFDEAGSPVLSPGSSGQAYEAVRSYCLGCAEVNFLDVIAVFDELPHSQLTLVFDGLQREGLLQAGADKDTFIVAQQGQAPAAGSGSGKCDGSHPQQGSQADGDQAMLMEVDAAAAEEAAGDTSWQGKDQGRQQQQEQQISQMMTGLSMDGSRAVGAARGLATGAAVAVNASVLGRAMQAGSLVSGLPGQPTGLQAPTAAANQVDAAAADEPSVQQDGADQQLIWFEASQQSLVKIPGTDATAAAAAKAHPSKPSRLRKASYVDKPIYQNSKQRSRSSKRTAEKEEQHQQQQLGVAAGVQKLHASKGAGRKGATANKGTPVRGSRLSGMK